MEGATKGLSIKAGIKFFLWFLVLKILLAIPFAVLAGTFLSITGLDISHYTDVLGDALVSFYLIRHVVQKRSFIINVPKAPQNLAYLVVVLLVIGLRLVFDNTLYFLTVNIGVPDWLLEAVTDLVPHPILIIVSTLIVAPIFEEVLFRGIFLKQFLKNYSQVTALLLSSFLFALMHLNLAQGINGFVIGLLFGIIYLKTNSLLLAIFAHFINNTYAILGFYNLLPFQLLQDNFSVVELLIGIVLLVLGMSLFQKSKREKTI